MALIVAERGIPGKSEIYGVVRIAGDPDMESAEFAIIVREDMTRQGVGLQLMRRIIDYARHREIGEIFGIVLRENRAMLALCDRLGFSRAIVEGETNIVRVTLQL